MNLAEFAALKPGDEIRNDMSHSDGIVASIDNNGVKIAWAGNELTFTYGVQSTAWFHWSLKPKIDEAEMASE